MLLSGALCVRPMHRGLYVIEVGLWKPRAIWSPATLDVSLSIHQFLLIAQSWDSVPWLSIARFLHRLNTLIYNQVWDFTSPWPWDWPDNAELGWWRASCGDKCSRQAVTSPCLVVVICISHPPHFFSNGKKWKNIYITNIKLLKAIMFFFLYVTSLA